jgi:[ribosomal protein S18]-alanine N-acetyltransferase
MIAASAADELVVIRPLMVGDLGDVLRIECSSFTTPWQETTFRSLLDRSDTDMLAAERRGVLIGYSVCWTVADQSELGNVAVAPEARGTGTGRRLVEAALSRLRRRGSRECFLEVRLSNAVAQALYRDLGFEVVGRRRAYYSKPTEDALVMRIALDDQRWSAG